MFGDYKSLPNVKATWFIDPPYQTKGGYVISDVDYFELGKWCKSRKGQVIVCENAEADWLDFNPLSGQHSQRGQRGQVISEYVWMKG